MKSGMPWPQTGATHYHAQLGPPDNGCGIKGLDVCYVVWPGSMGWDKRFIYSLVPCCGHDGYRAQVLQHPPIDSYRYIQIKRLTQSF